MNATGLRRGFTLLELLVVVAIIAVALGLLLPAVQQARAAGDRLTCRNKLRQIGLALHMYHDDREAFPPGMSLAVDQGRYQYFGWAGRLAPYLEQAALAKQIDRAFASDPNRADFYGCPSQLQLLGTPFRAFACPSDPRVPGPALIDIYLIAFSSYLGNAGTDQFSQDGVLYVDSRVRLTDITDGTSNTLLVGERPPPKDLSFGWWYRGWGQQKNGSAEMVVGVREQNTTGARYPCAPGPYHFTPGRFDNQCDMFHFWSPHSGGANFILADGSVRSLGYSADSVLPALATKSCGEVVSLPD